MTANEFDDAADRDVTPRQILARHNVHVIGSGDPIVFAHGFGASQSVWRRQVEAFSDTNRLILLDHVGASPSNYAAFHPDRYTSLHAFAADLLRIIEALNLNSCVVVGHSMSGVAALLASIKDCGQRIRKVITIGASACFRNVGEYRGGFDRQELNAVYDAMRTNYPAWAAQFARTMTAGADPTYDVAQFAQTLSQLPPHIALAVFQIAFECDHRNEMPLVPVSVDVIQSASDVAVPIEAARYLVDTIPNSTLSVLDTKGHLPHITAPNLLNTILLRRLY